jgi:hypothetical protein
MNPVKQLQDLADKIDSARAIRGEFICTFVDALRRIATQVEEERAGLISDLNDAGLGPCAECSHYFFHGELETIFDGSERYCPTCKAAVENERANERDLRSFLDAER